MWITKISQKCYDNNGRNGYVVLVTFLVISAASVAIAISLLTLGLGSSRTSFANEQSNQAKALGHACAEEALQQIRDSILFSGQGGLALGQGNCMYSVTNTGAQNRTITVSSTVGTVIRKVKVIINAINPQINVASWQEVAEF